MDSMAARFFAQGFRQSNESSLYPCPYPFLADLIPPQAAASARKKCGESCASGIQPSRARGRSVWPREKFFNGNICVGVGDGCRGELPFPEVF